MCNCFGGLYYPQYAYQYSGAGLGYPGTAAYGAYPGAGFGGYPGAGYGGYPYGGFPQSYGYTLPAPPPMLAYPMRGEYRVGNCLMICQ